MNTCFTISTAVFECSVSYRLFKSFLKSYSGQQKILLRYKTQNLYWTFGSNPDNWDFSHSYLVGDVFCDEWQKALPAPEWAFLNVTIQSLFFLFFAKKRKINAKVLICRSQKWNLEITEVIVSIWKQFEMLLLFFL